MRKGWSEIALGEILNHRTDSPTDDEITNGSIKIVNKIKFATGAIEFRQNGETKTGMIRICPGDIVVSGINAAKGAIAIYPDDADKDASATIHYASYAVKSGKADRKFIWWLLRSAEFKRILNIHLPGGIKTELKAKRFLPIPVPLPPLVEQQRIVAHLDSIEARFARVLKLRDESAAESLALLRALMNDDHCKGIRSVPMHELVTWRKPDTLVSDTESYRFAGVYSFGRGVFRKGEVSGMDFAYTRLTRLQAGEFTYPKLMAWEGSLGIVPDDCDGCHVSPEFPVFTVDQSKVLPEILDIHFKTPAVWKKLADISTGTNLRRRRLNPKAFLGYEFPLPPMAAQEHIKRIADQANEKRVEQEKVMEMEKALLPSLLDRVFNG